MIYNPFYFIKKMLYTFLSKKTLITIIIALVFFIILKINVFALSNDNIVFDEYPDYVVEYVQNNFPNYPSTTYDYILINYGGSWQVHFFPKTSRVWAQSLGQFKVSTNQQYCALNVNTNNQTVNGHGNIYTSNNATINYSTSTSNGKTHIMLYSTAIIYEGQTGDGIFYNPQPDIEPYFLDDLLSLTNLSGTEISIDAGNMSLANNSILFNLRTRMRGTTEYTHIYATNLTPSSEFYNANGPNGPFYEIPISIFKDLLTAGYELDYMLDWILSDDLDTVQHTEITVIYNPTAETVDDIELLNYSINSNFNKLNYNILSGFEGLNNFLDSKLDGISEQQREQFLQQYQAQQEANETAKDTNQFLKNQNFDSGNLNLPTSQGNDITQDGVNNIFTMIYNAFTSGTAQDLIIPIPFTSQNITIPANFLQDILNQTSFSWVKNIIELFWWYIISTYIIKDIAKKMEKMKSGDIENLQNDNIKEEML